MPCQSLLRWGPRFLSALLLGAATSTLLGADPDPAGLPAPHTEHPPEAHSGVATALRLALAGSRIPVAVDVIAAYPGASPEEVERQVTVPLEVALAGMPGLKMVRSKSVAGLCELRTEFDPGTGYYPARQEVINRLQFTQGLPTGVSPQISPANPARELLRYTLHNPRDAHGKPVYATWDLRALQDWTVEREFRCVPRVADVAACGGTVLRYEVRLDPDRLRRYGIIPRQVEEAIARGNANVGGNAVRSAPTVLSVRGIGLIGGGRDPMAAQEMREAKTPEQAAAHLRAEEQRRLHELRQTVIATVNNVPVRIGDVVEGGPLEKGKESTQGAVIGVQRPVSKVGLSRRAGDIWTDEDDAVGGIVYLRSGENAAPALRGVRAKIRDLNEASGRLLPGVRIEPYPAGAAAQDDLAWIYGAFPLSASLEEITGKVRATRELLRACPEVEAVLSQVGSATDSPAGGTNDVEWYLSLKPVKDWPAGDRPRTRRDLLQDLDGQLRRRFPGVDWVVSAERRDRFLEPFQPLARREHLVKISGPDRGELERLAGKVRETLDKVEGVRRPTVLTVMGPSRLDVAIDREKCERWGMPVIDVLDAVQLGVGGKTVSGMVEGEKSFEIVLRWPEKLCRTREGILQLPVMAGGERAGPVKDLPRLHLKDLVKASDKDGGEAKDRSVRAAAGVIYREDGRRLVAVRFEVQGSESAAAVREARKRVAPLIPKGCRVEWLGE